MVGLSTNYYNASSFAAIYLDANGYDIVPVNPVQAGKTESSASRSTRQAAKRPCDRHRRRLPACAEAPELARQAAEIGAKVLWCSSA